MAKGVRFQAPSEKRLGRRPPGAHLCPDCGMPLNVPGGATFASNGPKVLRHEIFCQQCGATCWAVYKRVGSVVNITVEKDKAT